jgi:hypothetical protein
MPVAVSTLACTLLLAAGCGGPELTDIGSGWFVDAGKAPWAHLYRIADGTRVLVDRQIDSYGLYYKVCLVYETSRPEGRVIFITAFDRTPYPVTASDTLQPWRIDADGLRRFDLKEDADGGRLLTVEFIGLSDFCTAAQLTPPLHDGWAETALVEPGKAKIVESVIDVYGADSVGNSTLSDAVRAGQTTVIDELLRAGADVNSSSRSGGTALITAVLSRNTKVLQQVLAAGARLNTQDDRGETALMWAARMSNREMAEMLIDAGADIAIRDDLGRNAATWVPDTASAEMRKLRARLDRAAAPMAEEK